MRFIGPLPVAIAVLVAVLVASACRPADPDLLAAEAFIDAFYSWDAQALAKTMEPSDDADRVRYYQGWAEGGNYQILERRPCARTEEGAVSCAITVRDDFGEALGYVATDTFTLQIQKGRIVAAAFEGDDPPVFRKLFDWMGEDRPEVFTGPCKDLFEGGTTPGDCARAVATAAREFAAR